MRESERKRERESERMGEREIAREGERESWRRKLGGVEMRKSRGLGSDKREGN